MRHITDHKLNGLNDAIAISAVDQPSPVGANHIYCVDIIGASPMLAPLYIGFQNGPIGEVGFNGLSNEALIAIVIDRLRGFQGENPKPDLKPENLSLAECADHLSREEQWGKFKCRDNAIAITHLEDALMRLQKRTRDRMARGVEGTLQK